MPESSSGNIAEESVGGDGIFPKSVIQTFGLSIISVRLAENQIATGLNRRKRCIIPVFENSVPKFESGHVCDVLSWLSAPRGHVFGTCDRFTERSD